MFHPFVVWANSDRIEWHEKRPGGYILRKSLNADKTKIKGEFFTPILKSLAREAGWSIRLFKDLFYQLLTQCALNFEYQFALSANSLAKR